ncbi:MAG: NlpC/P60 family protein [Vulcanimicrobiota bacterium]
MIRVLRLAACWLLLVACGFAQPTEKAATVATGVAPIFAQPSEGSEQVTQVLYGDEISVLDRQGEWLKVVVPAQYRTPQGYPGWVRAKFLSPHSENYPQRMVTVAYPTVSLRTGPSVDAPVVERVYLASRLPVASEKTLEGEKWYGIAREDGPLWVRATQVTQEKPLQPGQGARLVDLARKFEGTPYLWGGMTSKGIDCSGFMYTIYRTHGITLPRDADQQFEVGLAVEKNELMPGDMVFFGQPGDITHVGMYAGDGRFVHASGGSGVIESVLFQGWYLQNYRGARRALEKSGNEPRTLRPATL